jgi:gliding motility-associated lipoprotein GldH
MKGKNHIPTMNTTSIYNLGNSYPLAILLLIASSLSLSSCNTRSLYEETAAIDVHNWHMNDVKTFEVSFADSLQPLDFYVEVRNSTSYPNNKLFLFFNTTFPDGRSARDTLACVLASPDGRWLGSGLGSVKDNLFLIKRNVLLPRKGKYTFTLQQAMRDTIVRGIHDVGIKIKSSEITSN